MRAAGAVDELEVDVHRLAVPAEADGHLLSPISSKYSAESRCFPVARDTIAPGIGGTYTSGSTLVTVTCATSAISAGSAPCWIRNTSDANRAPSCTASTFVTTPDTCTGA